MDHDVVGIGGGLSSMISTLGNVVGVVLGGYFSFKVAKIALRWSGRIGGNAVEAGCGVEASANEDMSPVADDEGPRVEGSEPWQEAGMTFLEYERARDNWSDERWAEHWAMVAGKKADGTFGQPDDDDDVPF